MRATRRQVLGAAATGVGLLAAPPSATASGGLDQWIRLHARRIRTTSPSASLGDLTALYAAARPVHIVGLGETHGAREQADLKHRAVRVLLECNGFRTLAWEEDWTTGLEIDRYLTTGRGDLERIVAGMTGQWRSRQTVDLLSRLRAYNGGRPDPVRFFGVEYYYTGRLAYDGVAAYVATAAPARLAELRGHLDQIRPRTDDKEAHARWYGGLTDRSGLIAHARAVHRLVSEVAHRRGDPRHDLARHHARQVLAFHLHYDLPLAQQNVFREAHAAANLRWWQSRTGHRVAYWAALAHTAAAPDLRIGVPGGTDFRFPSTGSQLRRWYADRYLSIAFTLGSGTVGLGGDTAPAGPPRPGWLEWPLTHVAAEHVLLDLRHGRAPAVRSWLDEPVTMRGLPAMGAESTLSGGTAREWFDLLVHTRSVTAQEGL